ncbi:(Fe-S)-binding protein [Dethiobacter alkaliphilus]|uniref:Cysteine-rich domain-containing protein n=1 Tax=Dethiobacter alkaliphilus AHT 1 TaxID=555088 RepID=C0GCE4_DETAL|nr:(Fe-S)-binding protein [Dethiobacter alkaliphilus]EEG78879.1 conserved hypothetical protein [Dethiobacter alkaliphilus AHT 1]
MKQVFAPGCALVLYKPELAKKALRYIYETLGDTPEHLICCRHASNLEPGTTVINTCPGCQSRYKKEHGGISTISLWEILAESKTFPFPDYKGAKMTIHDACSTRAEKKTHSIIRKLLQKMNIETIEPEKTAINSICCGDSFYGSLPIDKVKEQMKKRANEMPAENVVVYCVSCINAMQIGGKMPRHIIDLLFGQETVAESYEPAVWHDKLQKYIDKH